jgi:hypothetical protein
MNRNPDPYSRNRLVGIAIGLLRWTLVSGAMLWHAEPVAGESCVQERWHAVGHKQSLQCTAGEVQTLSAAATSVIDPCAFPGDTATAVIAITFRDSPQGGRGAGRFDFGVFAATDGGDALTGACYVGVAPTSAPFVDGDGDACGDVPGEGIYTLTFMTTFLCIDNDGGGTVVLPICYSWRTGGANNLVCNGPADVSPGSPAKCDCVTVPVVNISVPKAITVTKAIDPADRPETFDLLIDGAVQKHAAGHGEGTGPVPVSPGTHSVSETNADGTPVSSSLWQSDMSCEDMVGRCTSDPTKHCVTDTACGNGGTCNFTPTPIVSCTDCTTLDVIVPDQQSDIHCTITNTQAPGG